MDSPTDQRFVAGGGSIATVLVLGFCTTFATMWIPLFMELDLESDAWASISIGLNALMFGGGAVLALLSPGSRRTYVGFSLGILATVALCYLFVVILIGGLGS